MNYKDYEKFVIDFVSIHHETMMRLYEKIHPITGQHVNYQILESGIDDKNAEDEERNEQFAELMQGVVLQTIVEEQRPGGLLWKK